MNLKLYLPGAKLNVCGKHHIIDIKQTKTETKVFCFLKPSGRGRNGGIKTDTGEAAAVGEDPRR